MIGHTAQKNFFLEAIRHGTLAHSYCLVGPDEVGKHTLALEVAAELLQVAPEKVLVNPNYIYVARAEDEKTGKLKKELSVSQARELRGKLQGSAWGRGYRVVVIDEVELMNAEAANALLKLLEEPPAKCIFFLLTTNDLALLPTIKSRAQVIQLSLVRDEEIKKELVARGYEPGTLQRALPFMWGRPGRALRLVQQAEELEWYETEVKRWQALRQASLYKKISLVEDLYGDKEDAVRGREVLQTVLDLWIMQARAELLNGEAPHSVFMNEVTRGKKLLSQNVHPRLIIENILLHLS